MTQGRVAEGAFGSGRINQHTAGAVAAVAAGVSNALTVAVIGRFGRHVGTLPAVTLVSIGSALIIPALLLARERSLRPLALVGRSRFLLAFSSVCGALFGVAVTVATPRIGTSTTLSLVIAAQAIGGLAADSLGLGRTARVPMTRLRTAAMLILVVGAAAAAYSR
jgi:uncharacterized membrane protein YdcZ (DUF606 family)